MVYNFWCLDEKSNSNFYLASLKLLANNENPFRNTLSDPKAI
jgi:hypothetical protein